ncbi:MAG: YdeI/OmpD-associated family protein [Rudaea sp.]
MGKRDSRLDAYIEKAAPFARPVLEHLREVVHASSPDLDEAIKWGMPAFLHEGRILCGMAAFKQHCALWFWRGKTLAAASGAYADGMGEFGRITTLAELPSKKVLMARVNAALALRAEGAVSRTAPAKKPPPKAPADLLGALRGNKKALATYDAFSPSAKREYVDWVVEAKREETRAKRVAQAVEWMAEGKQRNWKYANC